MPHLLNPIEARVLGSLMEKALSTPDYYPLSLNALVNACNQKSSRDPVVAYDDATVEAATESLEEKGLVHRSMVGRVPKYEERIGKEHNFVPRESAALCVLLLRGPQTVGEIRSRTTRLYSFENIDDVLDTLKNLEEWGLAKCLPRLPGHKESRYMHLLCGEAPDTTAPAEPSAAEAPEDPKTDAIQRLEAEIEDLRSELEALKEDFRAFKRQFE